MDAYEIGSLREFRRQVSALGPDECRLLGAPPPGRRIALLPGSFNPPTCAHVLLAERARAAGFDSVVWLLPRAPAGKPSTGLCLEDRLLVLSSIVAPPDVVAVTSASLYAEQAEAMAELLPRADLAFLTGSDKLRQIFDPSWYDDAGSALGKLFRSARLLVAPRGEDAAGIAALLDDPVHAPFADRIEPLRLHPAVGDVSSTRVRGLLAAGADASGLLPEQVREFCLETRAFAAPECDSGVDAYALRLRIMDVVLGEPDATASTFRSLVYAAREQTPHASRLRAMLADRDRAVLRAVE